MAWWTPFWCRVKCLHTPILGSRINWLHIIWHLPWCFKHKGSVLPRRKNPECDFLSLAILKRWIAKMTMWNCQLLRCVWLFVIPVDCGPQLLCPWNSPGKNTGVGSILFSRGSSPPRDWTRFSITGRFSTVWTTRAADNHNWHKIDVNYRQEELPACKVIVYIRYLNILVYSLQILKKIIKIQ